MRRLRAWWRALFQTPTDVFVETSGAPVPLTKQCDCGHRSYGYAHDPRTGQVVCLACVRTTQAAERRKAHRGATR